MWLLKYMNIESLVSHKGEGPKRKCFILKLKGIVHFHLNTKISQILPVNDILSLKIIIQGILGTNSISSKSKSWANKNEQKDQTLWIWENKIYTAL